MNRRYPRRLVIVHDVLAAYMLLPIDPDAHGPSSPVDPDRTGSIRAIVDLDDQGRPVYQTNPDKRAFWLHLRPRWHDLYVGVLGDVSSIYTRRRDAEIEHPEMDWARLPVFIKENLRTLGLRGTYACGQKGPGHRLVVGDETLLNEAGTQSLATSTSCHI